MRYLFKRRLPRELITGLLLVALAFRALIPVGFMPSGDHGFSLQICRAGFLAPMHSLDHPLLDQQGNPERPSHFEHCPFGTAPATGPISSDLAVALAAPAAFAPPAVFTTLQRASRPDRSHPPRAPPNLA